MVLEMCIDNRLETRAQYQVLRKDAIFGTLAFKTLFYIRRRMGWDFMMLFYCDLLSRYKHPERSSPAKPISFLPDKTPLAPM